LASINSYEDPLIQISNGDPEKTSAKPDATYDDQSRECDYGYQFTDLNYDTFGWCMDTHIVSLQNAGQAAPITAVSSFEVAPVTGSPAYYPRDRVQQVTTSWPLPPSTNPAAQSYSNYYTFDANSNRLSNTISTQLGANVTTTTSRTESYAYDALSRLTSVSYGDGESQTYSFDTMGNRTSKTDSGGTGTGATYTFDAANRLTSVTPTGGATAAVTFDADGNTLTDASGRTYTWDSENRMTSCTYNGDTTTYIYGYDGLRRSSTKDSVTTNYVYDGTNLVAEMRPNASGTLVVVTDYLLGAQGIEAKIDETAQTEAYYKIDPTTGARLFDANNNLIIAYRGVTSWYIYDGHGNVVGTVNGVTGAYTANPTLDVYGVPRATGAAATKQGYCGSLGHVTDDTGLVYMKARYYDANVGRFVSQDPSANGPNWYIYANDNPVNMADQDGKMSISDKFWVGGWMFAGILAASAAWIFACTDNVSKAFGCNLVALNCFMAMAVGFNSPDAGFTYLLKVGTVMDVVALPTIALLTMSESVASKVPYAQAAVLATVGYEIELFAYCLSIGTDA
jgi:RHS repeat-associated protein